MIREIEIGNYQSLRKVKLNPGRFTVVTGRTGVGKSAIIRAVRMLAFNARGTSYITRGEKTCSVSVSGDEIEVTGMDDDPWSAVIHRGGTDNYQLAVGINQKTYTKLAGKVPEPVTAQLRMGEVNFAGQFDKPYLQDATGSEVARVLGRLTNVTLLYRAAQEANRRKLAVAAKLKLRQGDLAALEGQIAQYATLPAEKAGVEAAEAAVSRISELSARRSRLDTLLTTREIARTRLELGSVPPEPPSLAKLEELYAARQRLQAALAARDGLYQSLRAKVSAEQACDGFARSSQQQLDAYAAEWDVCPTCGQTARKDHLEHST